MLQHHPQNQGPWGKNDSGSHEGEGREGKDQGMSAGGIAEMKKGLVGVGRAGRASTQAPGAALC